MHAKKFPLAVVLMLACLPAARLLGQATTTSPTPIASPATTGSAGGQTWTQETLSNGLRVVYAPMANTPATHVRVLYHVGSRDEQSDRQGFAHMFEHMMFRGSEHVAPEEHMKLITQVGGYCNAFTSFDETVYHETLPANYTEMALWLEADRMSSFKVSQSILATERNVVGEEYRLRANQPYGTLFDQLMPAVYKVHPYHWTPIGNMEQLAQAKAPELQEFFNKYYVPNNAILVIAGKIDVAQTQAEVHKYFGWIPGQAMSTTAGMLIAGYTPMPVERKIPKEPEQTEPRRLEVKMPAPLARVVLAYHMPPSGNEVDDDALNLMLSVLGDGQSSRLNKALVTADDPLCDDADTYEMFLDDGGVMGLNATLLPGKNVADAEKIARAEIAKMRDTLVTPEELEKVKQQNRMAIAQRFETAESTATELGNSMITFGQLQHVTDARKRLEAITPVDLQRVAKAYLNDVQSTTMVITPGSPQAVGPVLPPVTDASTAPAPVPARVVNFPSDYPKTPPITGSVPAATFEKGVSLDVPLPKADAPGQVLVMEDHRMPIVNWSLTLRAGSYAEPAGKEGLAMLTAEMVRRGPKGKTFDQFNEELESRAIDLSVNDGGDFTRISGSCLKEQFAFADHETTEMLLTPAFDAGEFQRLKDQAVASLQLSLNNAQTVSSRTLTKALYGDSVLGRLTTPESLAGITLDDVKKFYADIYRSDGAVLMFSGDVVAADAQKTGAAWLTRMPAGGLPTVTYNLPTPGEKERIILVDRPESKQSSIRLGQRAYSIASDEKFVGSLANQILSNGSDSRLYKYVRAEKGFVYGVQAVFSPSRQAGAFVGQTDTRFPTTTDTIQAMFKVFDDLRTTPIPAAELAAAKFRVAGGLLMTMQTVTDQAGRRVDGILNHYPIDYYDKYAQRLSQVTADQIKDAMNKYAKEDHMTVVVVGPAATLKPQLDKLGTVEVVTPAK